MSRASILRERAAKKPGRSSSAPPWQYVNGFAGNVVSGWTDSRVEQVRHFKTWVYVAIARIADAMAKAFPNLSIARDPATATEEQKRRFLPRGIRNRALVPMQQHEELEAAPADHPMNRLLRDPNVEDTAFDLWWETILFYKLTGSAYWWLPPNKAGLPMNIYVLPSHWVWPVADKRGVIDGYQLRPVEGFWQGDVIPKEDVVHFKSKSPISKWDGYGALSAGNMWIDCSDAMDRTRWNSFKNGIVPGLTFEFDGTRADPSEDELLRIRSKIEAVYSGPERSNKPILVPPGMTAKPLGVSVKEMEFTTSFEQIARAVLALFGVPLAVAGWSKDQTFGGNAASLASFCTFTVNPIAQYFGQQITEKVAWRYDEKLRVWWPDQTPEDPAAREQELRTDMAGGVRTWNEHRAARGLCPMPGGDERCYSKPPTEKSSKKKPGSNKPEEPNYSHNDGNNESGTSSGKELVRFSLNGVH
jgi:HK97 family phage portal protein